MTGKLAQTSLSKSIAEHLMCNNDINLESDYTIIKDRCQK